MTTAAETSAMIAESFMMSTEDIFRVCLRTRTGGKMVGVEDIAVELCTSGRISAGIDRASPSNVPRYHK